VLARVVHYLGHFGFSHFKCENAAFSDAILMNMQHDARGFLAALVEKPAQHRLDKAHGRIIIVQQQHPVHAGLFSLGPGTGNDFRPGSQI